MFGRADRESETSVGGRIRWLRKRCLRLREQVFRDRPLRVQSPSHKAEEMSVTVWSPCVWEHGRVNSLERPYVLTKFCSVGHYSK